LIHYFKNINTEQLNSTLKEAQAK